MSPTEFHHRYKFNPSNDIIGKGRFGTVYKAYDFINDNRIAIKEVRRSKDQDIPSLSEEVELCSNLPLSKFISRYIDCYQFEGANQIYEYAILQYYPFGDLEKVLKRGIDIAKKMQLVDRIIDGVHFLHSNDIIHRDLKPSNILIVEYEAEFTPKISDFGVSSKVEGNAEHFTNNFISGSANYIPPEFYIGKSNVKNADFWSLGCIVFEVFTGEKPIDLGKSIPYRERYEILKSFNIRTHPLFDEIPEKYQTLIEQCLIHDPRHRIRDLKDFVSEYITSADEKTIIDSIKPISINSKKWVAISVMVVGLTILILYKIGSNNTMSSEDQEANPITVLDSQGKSQKGVTDDASESTTAKDNSLDIQQLKNPQSKIPTYNTEEKGFQASLKKENEELINESLPSKEKSTSSNEVKDAELTEEYKTIKSEINTKMVLIPSGSFRPGCNKQGYCLLDEEYYLDDVEVKSFYISKYEVSQKLWRQVMGDIPKIPVGNSKPIANVTMEEVMLFIKALNELTHENYRLPTELEWEYVAKDKSRQSFTQTIDSMEWYGQNSSGKAHDIGSKPPNGFGVYDIAGNVSEWTSSNYSKNYSDDIQEGNYVVKGGSFASTIEDCRYTSRQNFPSTSKRKYLGFRLAK